jgi:hypothetical protein
MQPKRVGASIEPGAELSLEYPWSADRMHSDYRSLRITVEVNFEARDRKYRATLYNDTITFVQKEVKAADTLGLYVTKAIKLAIFLLFIVFLPAACSSHEDPVSWASWLGYGKSTASAVHESAAAVAAPIASAPKGGDDDSNDAPSIKMSDVRIIKEARKAERRRADAEKKALAA